MWKVRDGQQAAGAVLLRCISALVLSVVAGLLVCAGAMRLQCWALGAGRAPSRAVASAAARPQGSFWQRYDPAAADTSGVCVVWVLATLSHV
jgi:hypothetical protein